MPSTEPILRPLRLEDAEQCAGLAARVQWGHTASFWQQRIQQGGESALCLTIGDQIVTTAIAVRYAERLAWVGVVITDPAFQGRGLARKLMTVVMEYLADKHVASIMLDASPEGFPIYDKLGFRSLYRMKVYTGEASAAPVASVLPAREADLAEIIALDAQLLGVDRSRIIRSVWEPDVTWLTRENDRVTGYLLAQVDHRGAHLGPWYHPSAEGANDLLLTALSATAGKPLRLHIPEPNTAAQTLIEQQGLTCNRYCTRMLYGAEPPGRMTEQYGILAFATG